jgi:hypothetical protein
MVLGIAGRRRFSATLAPFRSDSRQLTAGCRYVVAALLDVACVAGDANPAE